MVVAAGVQVDMAQLLAHAAGRRHQVNGVLVTENGQRFIELARLYGAVGGEIATLGVAFDEGAAGEQGLGASVVAGAEVSLGQPESVLVVSWCVSIST